ncbi:MAG: YceI family protein [Gemmatimonadaceae bacterium]
MRELSSKASFSVAAAIAITAAVVAIPVAAAGRVAAPGPVRMHYIVAPTGNEARYRVREVLVGLDFPNDAVGVTKGISGGFVVDTSGKVVEDSSKIIIDVAQLKSDKDKRDAYIRENTMHTDKFPTVELMPSFIKGVTGKPPTSGTRPVEILANLKVLGNLHPITWHGSATFNGDDVTGTISTAFTFTDMGLVKPTRAILLTVEDTVKLEYDFHFTKK